MKRFLNCYRDLKTFLYTRKVSKKCYVVGSGLRVNGPSQVFGRVELGNNVNFNGMSIRGTGRCVIGDNFHSGINCVILTSNHDYNGERIPYDSKMVNKEVIIGNQVWIGDNVMILGGATIGEGAIIQAGSVVVGHIPPLSIAGGNPAKVFKMRDAEHYNKCKEQGLYY